MIAEYTERIALRLPIEDKKEIDQLVKKGNYLNRSHFVRIAIKELLNALR